MNETSSTPPALLAWYTRAERFVLRACAAASLLLVLASLVTAFELGTHHGLPRTLGLVGVAAMLATPSLRLILLIAAFATLRDRFYVALAIVILAALVAGFLGG